MKKRTTALLMVATLILLSTVFVWKKRIAEEKSLNTSEVVELSYKDISCNGLNVYQIIFLADSGFSKQAVLSHALDIVSQEKEKFKDLFALVLFYYDDIIYKEFGDDPIAVVSWAPYDSLSNVYDVPIGDYSHHTFLIDYLPLNEEYELSLREKEIYCSLQNYAMEELGHFITPRDSTMDSATEYMQIYEYISQKENMTTGELEEIRIKATMRRSFNVNTPQVSHEDKGTVNVYPLQE